MLIAIMNRNSFQQYRRRRPAPVCACVWNTKTAIKCVFQTHLIYVLRDLNNNHDTVWNVSAIHYFGMFYWLIVWREQYVNRSYGSYENVSHLVGWWLLLPGVLVNTIHGVTWGHALSAPRTLHPPGSAQEWIFSAKIKHADLMNQKSLIV